MRDPRADCTHVCIGPRPPVLRYESAFDAAGIAAWRAMVPESGRYEQVILQPGAAVPRAVRRRLDRKGAGAVLVSIDADADLPAGAPGPASFDATSVQWALSNAALGVVWSGGWNAPLAAPQRIRTELAASRRAVLILTRAEHEWDWLAVVAKYAPPAMAPVLVTTAEGAYHA